MYADFERSKEGGRPVELYTFSLGADVYRYNSGEDTYTYQGQPYLSRRMKRTSPSAALEDKRGELVITMPADDPVASRYVGIVPGEQMSVTIVRVHRDDPDQEGLKLWDARVVGSRYTEGGYLCEIRTMTSESAVSHPIPRYKYQGQCNHVLYSSACGVDRNVHKHTGEVTGQVGQVLTVNGLEAALGANAVVPGYVKFGEDYRLIIGQSGDDITVLLDFEQAVLGQDVDVFRGCDHDINGDCLNVFSNTANHGGFPAVPTRNPFADGLD